MGDEKNLELYQRYLELSKQDDNIIFAGRLGAYKYYDMDKAMIAAMDLIQEELNVYCEGPSSWEMIGDDEPWLGV